jgi:DNA ligase-1
MFAKHRDYDDISQLGEVKQFLAESVKDQCEGLMIKNLVENATYEPSKRSSNWFKLKKDYMDSGALSDSLDLVVVGADWGKGKRTGVFGSFLMASYDEETNKFQTVTKVATGLTD